MNKTRAILNPKKRANWLLSFLLFVCFQFCLSAEPQNITIAGDQWCPINCAQESTEQGFMIEAAREALAFQGFEITYLEMPWKRAVNLARSGQIDAIVGAFEGDAPDFVFPQRALLKISPSSLFGLSELDWQFDGLASLNHVKLGAIGGYDYGDALNSFIRANLKSDDNRIIQIFGDDASRRSIELLRKRRADVIVEADVVFWQNVNNQNDAESFKQIAVLSKPEDCFIAFSPALARSKKVANALHEGLQILEQNGRLTALANKYQIAHKHLATAPKQSD